ncbi:GumC family protein [Pendulispora albinea]|uniref:Polysaccharide chain length determinant N-terminal domain-containing protein n=1 Tax=Pendulispora albinea TaxID=2741071 RepID=A0ABZ2M0T4_9BACT
MSAASGQFAAIAPRELTPRERMERARVIAKRATHYWKSALALFVLGAGISIAVAMNLTRIYRSECVVLVRPAIKTDDRDESPSERAMKLAPKLKDTLLTRTRLEPVIREFNLYPKTVESKGMIDAVEEMRLHVGFRGRDSETFVISFEDADPDRTRSVTQKLAESTMEEFRKGNLSTSKQQAEFLAVEEKRAEEALEAANRQLATFLSIHPEFAAETRQGNFSGQGAGAPFGQAPPLMPGIVAAQHSTDPQLASLYRQKARLDNEVRARQTQGAAPAVNDSVANLAKARDEAARRAAQAQADLADKITHFTEQHPDVIAARAQVDAAGKTLQTAEAQLEAAKHGGDKSQVDNAQVAPDLQKRLEDVQRQIAQRQAEVAKRGANNAAAPAADTSAKPVPSQEPMNPLVLLETEWQRLLRATSDAKSSHDDLARRMDRASLRASAAEATGDAQMEIIDPAYRPTRPARGGRTNAALLGLGLTMFVAVGYAFARVATNDTLIDAHDVELLRLIPVLGTIPKLPPSPANAANSSNSTNSTNSTNSPEPPPRNSVRSDTPAPRNSSIPADVSNGGGNSC